MSFNAEKMAKLISHEIEFIEERCDGYKKKILDSIIEILKSEKEHKGQKTNIQQKVDTACYTAGDFLWRELDKDHSKTEDT